ncbi:MAG: cohesin domain-containing protein [Bacillota bacterium]|nr:cohesin domain-containing protein [Bacillota bacterium]
MKCTKILAILVCILIAFSISSLVFADATTSKIIGDVDRDGNFDSDDYAILRQSLLGMISKDSLKPYGDVDGDGLITSDDYAYMKRFLLGMITAFPVETKLYTPTPTITKKSSLSLTVDKTDANQGDIITATLSIKDVDNFAGYQANVKYDPTILQPVILFADDYLPYGNLTPVDNGELLTKAQYNPVDVVFHDVDVGILSFGRSYVSLASYRSSGNIETTGSIATIKFKVLRAMPTKIYFKGTNILPSGIEGTALYDFNAAQITKYDIIQPDTIMSYSTPTSTIAATPTPTLAPTTAPTITPTPTENTKSTLNLSVDKKDANQGDIITATLSISNIPNFAGYQATLKYDPTVLQPVYSDGVPYDSTSAPELGTLLQKRYSPTNIAANDLSNGLLNFGRVYMYMNLYKNSGDAETSGTIAVIHFKVLKNSPYAIKYIDNPLLDSDIDGALLFDWNGAQFRDYRAEYPTEINY